MRLAALALTLLLIPDGHMVNRREPSGSPAAPGVSMQELQNLEAQFKRIDEESDSVTVKVTGDEESSATLKISVERKVYPEAGAKSANSNTSRPRTEKETLLDIDLSKLDVPDEYINAKIAALFSALHEVEACPGVKVMQVGAGVDYKVVEDYTYDSGTYRVTVLNGFVYDRASIPRFLWVIIDKDSLSNVAPLLHDLLYRHGGVLPENQVSPYRKFSRKETDDIFYELMTKCGVARWRREAAYQAVRRFSGFAWKG